MEKISPRVDIAFRGGEKKILDVYSKASGMNHSISLINSGVFCLLFPELYDRFG